jgi:hypothetical protein
MSGPIDIDMVRDLPWNPGTANAITLTGWVGYAVGGADSTTGSMAVASMI